MNKEIKDLKDLKVGNKYKLTATLSHPWVLNGTEYMTKLLGVDVVFGYRFKPIEYDYNIDIKPEEFIEWYVEEAENICGWTTPKDKAPTPAIEMLVKGIDDLILQMEKPNTPTILELSLREILLAGGEITIRQSKDI